MTGRWSDATATSSPSTMRNAATAAGVVPGIEQVVEARRAPGAGPGDRAGRRGVDPVPVAEERHEGRAPGEIVQVAAGDDDCAEPRAADAVRDFAQPGGLARPARAVVGERGAEMARDHDEGAARGADVDLDAVAGPQRPPELVELPEVAHVRVDGQPRQRCDVDSARVVPLDEPRLRVPGVCREPLEEVAVLDLLQHDDVGVETVQDCRDRSELRVDRAGGGHDVQLAGRDAAVDRVEQVVHVPGRDAHHGRRTAPRARRPEVGCAGGEQDEEGEAAHGTRRSKGRARCPHRRLVPGARRLRRDPTTGGCSRRCWTRRSTGLTFGAEVAP